MEDLKAVPEQKAELKALWDMLEISAEFPSKEIAVWLVVDHFTVAEIASAIKVLARHENGLNAPVPYMGKTIRNARLAKLTPEERDAQISAMRSAIGTMGAVAGHKKKIAEMKLEFARSCQKLPEFAGISSKFAGNKGSGSVKDSDSEKEREKKQNDKPKNHTSKAAAAPPVASLPLSNPEQEQVKSKPQPPTNGKTNGVHYPPGFDSWSNAQRLAWLNPSGAGAEQQPDQKQSKTKLSPRKNRCIDCGELLTADHDCMDLHATVREL